MRSKRKADAAERREWREFSAEFKAEAVRMAAERRAAGIVEPFGNVYVLLGRS